MNDLLEVIQTPAIITRHRLVKEHFGTTTLAEFIERVNEEGSLDSLDFADTMDFTEPQNLNTAMKEMDFF